MIIMEPMVMRDALIDRICDKMATNDDIMFISADFGSPALDKLRNKYKDRFINVGIAEQNLINISVGLALEGYIVYAYAIAPFLTMRAYEQIRNNVALLAQVRKLNINLISVGVGLSYDVTGPTHHCLEDISIMRTLPNIMFFSPCDCVTIEKFVDTSIAGNYPKYIRLDGKKLQQIYDTEDRIKISDGFCELIAGEKICLISTGYMTHTALESAAKLKNMGINIGVIDMFILNVINDDLFLGLVKKYKYVITLEEGFINKGGMDAFISGILRSKDMPVILKNIGFDGKYVFDVGDRAYLHKINRSDSDSIINVVIKLINLI